MMASQTPLTSPTATANAAVSPPIPQLSTAGATGAVAIGQLPTMQQLPTIRDPEWLKLEVCREFQRGACKRTSEECKYAHPGKNIQVMPDGKVIACFDALKSRCTRESCKYLHPPGHLKQQLEINGRNNLIQQRAMLQMMPQTILQSPVQQQAMQGASNAPQPAAAMMSAAGLQQAAASQGAHLYSPAAVAASTPTYTMLPTGEITLANSPLFYYSNNVVSTTAHPMALANSGQQVTAIASPLNALSRADRLEVCRDFQRGNCTRGEHECRYAHPVDRSMIEMTDNTVTVCMDCIKGRCTRDKCKYFHPPPHLQAKIRASQHQASFLPTMAAPSLSPVQQAVVANNNASNALGQPPLKRHALDSKMVTQSAALGAPLAPSPNGTLYSYGLPIHQQSAATAAHAYYQVPLQYSIYGAAAPANIQTAPGLATVSLPTANGQTSAPSATTLALLNGQSQNSSLTVCRDYQSGKCARPYCRFVHVTEDFVEVKDDKVTVCKDALLGKCLRSQCRFFHYPPQQEPQQPQYPSYPNNIHHQLAAQPEAQPITLQNPSAHGMLSPVPAGIYPQPVLSDLQVSL
uniref:muscleblind-like protein 1 isoform X2 n=1 Tax=Styela clava TaxID=7725 RepID=UPI0019395A8D|nr:muscleblind-like protein 1 isoform X2 [Styela clava]